MHEKAKESIKKKNIWKIMQLFHLLEVLVHQNKQFFLQLLSNLLSMKICLELMQK